MNNDSNWNEGGIWFILMVVAIIAIVVIAMRGSDGRDACTDGGPRGCHYNWEQVYDPVGIW